MPLPPTPTDLLLITLLGAIILLGWMSRRANHRIYRRLGRIERELETGKSKQQREHQRELRALSEGQRALSIQQGISALGFKYPVFFHGWCIDPFLAEALLRHIQVKRPRVILELGSGMSTALIATALDRLGLEDARHIAVDHEAEFLDHTRANLELQGLSGRTELWHCPLSANDRDEPPWYEGLAERLAETKVDLVLVDGPPGHLHPHSRRPALHVLRPFLSESAVLYLDDANREHERATVQDWKQAYPEFVVRLGSRGHGYAEFRHAPRG